MWFHPLPPDQTAGNLRVQSYHGQPVLTWWQGESRGGYGIGDAYIADSHYQVTAHVTPPAGLRADIHEFRLLPDGRALLTAYREVPYDLSPIGGPTKGRLLDSIAVVIDVATNTTLLQWSALDHVPISDSYLTPGQEKAPGAGDAFDAFHMNSIAAAPNGDLLISLRHTSALYAVDSGTGKIHWQLGGKRSSFRQVGAGFSFQHDAEFADANTVRLFDNDANGLPDVQGAPESTVQWIHLDYATRTATLQRSQPHPDFPVTAAAMGSAQPLPNGNTLIGWGVTGRVSEVTPTGQLVYDATMPSTYRAFLSDWRGAPSQPPTLSIGNEANSSVARAIWNGATDVAQWQLLSGEAHDQLTVEATAPWSGLDTRFVLGQRRLPKGTYRIRALDDTGHVLGESPTIRI
ncbi:arylsulfotransferase family protein [Mycobacterium sp. AT1]|uniref:arylsulfotransferase family protein n=1 Tax=Mycobacterium sp. AT1 TaxID=1961706 RepID=UPI0009AE3FC5|nr:arylsulfotransferase family protein [Mycobacterium sp. AT1]